MALERVYRTKPDTWYDAGTYAVMADDLGEGWGLFIGFKDGQLDEEVCAFDEFEELMGDVSFEALASLERSLSEHRAVWQALAESGRAKGNAD